MPTVLVADDPTGRLVFAALSAGGPEVDLRLVPADRLTAAREREPAAWLLAEPTGRSAWTTEDETAADPRWLDLDRTQLLADPAARLAGLCATVGVAYDAALLAPLEQARRVEQLRVEGEAAARAALGSQHTAHLPGILAATGGSLVVSTYQAGRVVLLRARDGALNTHFRAVDKPMGIAVGPGRVAIGTRAEVWDYRDVPAAAPNVEAEGDHDACLVLRGRHVTGDVALHDLAWAGEELWGVNTAFSCLCTFDQDSSFVPRWQPTWISALQPGDRCHLNGLAVRDGRPAWVTALGTGDEPASWRADKATGGVLVDVASSEVVVGGLSMPHSPRWAGDRLYVLESGEGRLDVVDLDAGTVEPVCELPGFPRGMAITGDVAWVGLSQIRESSSFADLPITHRLEDRQSGVWAIDLTSGRIVAFLRFADLVQEVFEVAFLPGARWPELAEPGGRETLRTYVLGGD